MDCLCVVCHTPIAKTRQPVTGVVCNNDGGQCRARLRDVRRGRVGKLAPKYQRLRLLNAYRRDLQTIEASFAVLLHRGGWLAVGQ